MSEYSPVVIEAAKRVASVFENGCDRCDGTDLALLEEAGLMDQTVCDDTFGQDTLEVGETMWVFNDDGKAFLKSLGVKQ